jgi:hypothetical protein
MLFFFLLRPSAGLAETSSEKEEKCEYEEQAAQEHPHHIQQVVLHKTEAMRGTSHGGVMRMPDTQSPNRTVFPVVIVLSILRPFTPRYVPQGGAFP